MRELADEFREVLRLAFEDELLVLRPRMLEDFCEVDDSPLDGRFLLRSELGALSG